MLTSLFLSISAKKSVHNVLWLVCGFLSASWLYIILSANFLAMLLIIVYVGALGTLFLFVVMMANQQTKTTSAKLYIFKTFSIALILIMFGLLIYKSSTLANFDSHLLVQNNFTIHNTNLLSIGEVLYTKYSLLFES